MRAATDSIESSLCLADSSPEDESVPDPTPDVRLLLCPGPRFGGATAARFLRSASDLSRTGTHVLLDMSEVTAVDAAGLLAIAGLARACRAAGGGLSLCGATPAVRRLLATSGVHRVADAYHTRRHAGFA